MKVENITGIIPDLQKQTLNPVNKTADSFGSVLTGFIKDVNQSQLDSGKATVDFINGKNIELHEVMIAGEKAKTQLELLLEIRNKALDMYKELTRMQS